MPNKFELKYQHLHGTEEMIVQGLSDEDVVIRRHAASHLETINCSPETRSIALSDPDREVRRRASLMGVQFTPAQIELGLTDEFHQVRLNFARYTLYTPTDAQLERGLKDHSSQVKTAFFHRDDIKLTPHQIARGLACKTAEVRWAIASKNIKFTAIQIDSGLQDSDPGVREAFASNLNFVPSEEQILRALNAADLDVIAAFILRKDIHLTKEYISIIFNTNDWHCFTALSTRDDFIPTEAQESIIFNHDDYWMSNITEEMPLIWASRREKQALTLNFISTQDKPNSPQQCL